jgi:hypothetical protein
LAFETPVPACAPLDRVLPQARAFLEPCGIKLADRWAKIDPRKRSAKLRNPNHSIGRSLSLPAEFRRPFSWAASSRTWTASSLTAVHPSALKFRCEEIHPVEHPVQIPALSARAGRLLRRGALAKIAPAAHDRQRERFLGLGVTDFQRFRAAAHIQIRGPVLRNSTISDLPVLSTSLPWRGVPMVSEIRLGATPLPLRPSLQTPSLR